MLLSLQNTCTQNKIDTQDNRQGFFGVHCFYAPEKITGQPSSHVVNWINQRDPNFDWCPITAFCLTAIVRWNTSINQTNTSVDSRALQWCKHQGNRSRHEENSLTYDDVLCCLHAVVMVKSLAQALGVLVTQRDCLIGEVTWRFVLWGTAAAAFLQCPIKREQMWDTLWQEPRDGARTFWSDIDCHQQTAKCGWKQKHTKVEFPA